MITFDINNPEGLKSVPNWMHMVQSKVCRLSVCLSIDTAVLGNTVCQWPSKKLTVHCVIAKVNLESVTD